MRKQEKSKYLLYRLASILVVLTFLLITICSAIGDGLPSLELSASELTIPKGKNVKVTAALTGTKAKLIWESDDPAIASVNNGNVTGKQNGTTNISCSATLDDGQKLYASCIVTVYTPLQKMKAVQSLTVDIGQESDPIEIVYTPIEASYQSVLWTSDDESVAVVNENGQVKGISEGTCTVTATSTEPLVKNEKPKSIKCKVTVLCPVSSITLTCDETTIKKGKSTEIIATVYPENATNKKVIWESSDSNIAVVKNGKVTAKAGGTTTIKCYVVNQTGETVSADISLKIISPVISITPQSKQNIVNVGFTSEPLGLNFQPDDATNKDIIWSSEDETIVTISADGRITGVRRGKTKVIATVNDPYSTGTPKMCSIPVTVNQGAEKLVISGNTSLAKGKTIKLSWSVSPEDVTNKKIEWSSSDSSVAKVSNGTVSGVGIGTCIITGTVMDGSGVTAQHEITVLQAVTKIQPYKKGKVVITEGKSVKVAVYEVGIFADAPASWFKFKPPTRRSMTEEQKQALRDRLASARKKLIK